MKISRDNHSFIEIGGCIELLKLKNDYTFRRVFGYTGNEEIPKYLTKWNIREETYGKIILTDVLELYIVNLSKIEKYSENRLLDTWVKFISNLEDLNMENADEQIKKAKEVLDEISEDEHEQYLAHLREKYIFERQGIEEAGFDKGAKAKQIEIAKNLKQNKIDIEIIMKCTGLTKEEIEKL